MTTSISNASTAMIPARAEETSQPPQTTPTTPAAEIPHTLWSRFIVLTLCLAVILSTLAFGTVHSWSLAVFQAGAGAIVILWAIDAWRTRVLRFSRNFLQLPVVGLFALGVVQLLPLGGATAGGLANAAPRTLSLDPYATRFALVQILSLFIYFAAALTFIDTPRRLRLIVRTLVIFGFLLAILSMMQHFLDPSTILWIRQPKQAQPFGPFINRHHFAGYMELALALPLGLLVSGAVAIERRLLYGFAAAMMAFALILTNSRGGMLSLVAEILFVFAIVGVGTRKRRRRDGDDSNSGGVRSTLARTALGGALVVAIFFGVLFFGGEDSLSRLAGTVNQDDPTTGRLHFWEGTMEIIREHPFVGTGLGAFSVAYTRHDTRNGTYRLEQAHNDYLQILSDAGLVGATLGLLFVAGLFRGAIKRAASGDKFRSGVAKGALAGCFAVLVHSFFDFTLHTTANALLFLLLAALATINGRVEEPDLEGSSGRRRRRRRRSSQQGTDHTSAAQA